MLVDPRTQRKLAQAVASALERAGLTGIQAAVLLVRVEDKSSPTESTVMATMTGDQTAIGGMLYEHLRRMISEPITIVPYAAGELDPNAAPPPSKGN